MARIPIRVERRALNVELGKSSKDKADWIIETIREISTPSPVKVLMVTNDAKKEDIFGSELPSISNADSGVSMMMASVSNTDPAMLVTKNRLRTCHIKYREKAFI